MSTVVTGSAYPSQQGADLMLYYLQDAINNASSPKIDLVDEVGNVVKSLDPVGLVVYGEDNYWQLQIHITDSSTDEYTFKTVRIRGLYSLVSPAIEVVVLRFTLDSPITKASTDVLDLYLKYRFANTFPGA